MVLVTVVTMDLWDDVSIGYDTIWYDVNKIWYDMYNYVPLYVHYCATTASWLGTWWNLMAIEGTFVTNDTGEVWGSIRGQTLKIDLKNSCLMWLADRRYETKRWSQCSPQNKVSRGPPHIEHNLKTYQSNQIYNQLRSQCGWRCHQKTHNYSLDIVLCSNQFHMVG